MADVMVSQPAPFTKVRRVTLPSFTISVGANCSFSSILLLFLS